MVLSLHKFFLSRYLLPATRDDFADAIDLVSKEIEKVSGQKPDLKITFYKAARGNQEIPELCVPQFLGKAHSLKDVSFKQWWSANIIQATLETESTSERSSIEAKIRIDRVHDRKVIQFNIDPHYVGEKIGYYILNEHPRFAMWTRGISP